MSIEYHYSTGHVVQKPIVQKPTGMQSIGLKNSNEISKQFA